MTGSPLMLRSGGADAADTPNTAGTPNTDVRRHFTVTGVVQGVGFRLFVHRVASELGLAGFVGNDSGAVFLEAQGERGRVEEFGRRLRADARPLARIAAITVTDVAADGTPTPSTGTASSTCFPTMSNLSTGPAARSV